MRILLFGGNGQVGGELRRSLAALGEVVAATRSGTLEDGTACERADFDAPGSLPALVARIAPDIVVNAAAHTAVDRAESEPEAAFRANAQAPLAIAEACARRDALLVHYSTDYVFDGRGTRPYREDDPAAPASVYGASKLAGEEAIRASGARHLVLRTAWVYAAHGRNFLHTMLRLAGERDELRVVADQVGTPTAAALIAGTTAQLLARPPSRSGTWHLTATGATTWHGFAEAIMHGAHARGLIARVPRVLPIATADYPTPAARPAYSVLDCSALQREFRVALPGWQEGLSRTLDDLAGW
ncbi:dTDP-4-dehydrorhamnose reductase [Luteimonas sp. 50]|uniref:dTDP-4-dehydrorhamnose reductase n=1 Tax=Cognatiluteimonas sedimenti TaxID=2927791 RepID=A0ABT0A4H9_9GAMM|nr:dTDP-4-dehydrorhamnose reductase [Lysobacter sedimenti]MCJ0825876.1 dTDP-4-dehydrorhamnose reductase [Lysobacter sedimenti]